jgi:hypothetical protein
MQPFLFCFDPGSDDSSPSANLRLPLLRVNHGGHASVHDDHHDWKNLMATGGALSGWFET